jgi:hypothetical protein
MLTMVDGAADCVSSRCSKELQMWATQSSVSPMLLVAAASYVVCCLLHLNCSGIETAQLSYSNGPGHYGTVPFTLLREHVIIALPAFISKDTCVARAWQCIYTATTTVYCSCIHSITLVLPVGLPPHLHLQTASVLHATTCCSLIIANPASGTHARKQTVHAPLLVLHSPYELDCSCKQRVTHDNATSRQTASACEVQC